MIMHINRLYILSLLVMCSSIAARCSGSPAGVESDTVDSSNAALCRPVMECVSKVFTDISPPLYSLDYVFYTNNKWIQLSHPGHYSICTRSDSNVLLWKISFRNYTTGISWHHPKLTLGHYCMKTTTGITENKTATPLDPVTSGICSHYGSLYVKPKLANYEGTKGRIVFIFKSGNYTAKVPIQYAPSGVQAYSKQSTVYFTKGRSFVALRWTSFNLKYPYFPKIYYNGKLIVEKAVVYDMSRYSFLVSVYTAGCGLQDETSLDSTRETEHLLYVANPSASSGAGEYVLTVPWEKFPEEVKSATVKLALEPTVTMAAPIPTPTSLLSSLSSSILPSPSNYVGSSSPPPTAAYIVVYNPIQSTGKHKKWTS